MKWFAPDYGAIRRDVLTLIIALCGGLVAHWLNMPAAFLAGGAIAVAIAGFSGLHLSISKPLMYLGFIIVGMAVGANVASDSLQLVRQWPLSMIWLVVMLVFIVGASWLVLRRLFGLDRATAFYAAMPGHMSLILALTASGVADSRRISIIMGVRVLALTIILPIGAMLGGSLPSAPPASGPVLDLASIGMLAVACVIGGVVLEFLKVPGGLILGAMVVAVAGKLAGFYQGQLPDVLTGFAFVLMGALIGSRMSGVSWFELRQSAAAGLAVTAVAVGIVTASALLLSTYMNMPLGQIWLGLAPGALEAMIALGLAFGYDSAFIAAHHTWRLLILGFAIPLFAPFFSSDKQNSKV
ncbi:MAG: AbrB family transcriptional regulator [Devosiaceae bacterium]|nr:AbrB family transcriptional regulator [Devosiaceae bacterium]